jgi:hypothetical protein
MYSGDQGCYKMAFKIFREKRLMLPVGCDDQNFFAFAIITFSRLLQNIPY